MATSLHCHSKESWCCPNITDIWLWSQEAHYTQLEQLRQTLETSAFTLKLPKCSFIVPQVNVFGHIVPAQGIQPDNAKIYLLWWSQIE